MVSTSIQSRILSLKEEYFYLLITSKGHLRPIKNKNKPIKVHSSTDYHQWHNEGEAEENLVMFKRKQLYSPKLIKLLRREGKGASQISQGSKRLKRHSD